jgi:hypothetical protein
MAVDIDGTSGAKCSSVGTNIDGNAAKDRVDQPRRERSHQLHAQIERIGKGDLAASLSQTAANDPSGTFGRQY